MNSKAIERVALPALPPRPVVLVVDGHDDTRDLYVFALGRLGFEPVDARDSARAFTSACDACPDVIVTDVSLPTTDGWRLVRLLKRDARTRHTPVVVLTAYAPASVRERAEREGCAAVWVKPYLPDRLATDLRALLARHGSRQRAPAGS